MKSEFFFSNHAIRRATRHSNAYLFTLRKNREMYTVTKVYSEYSSVRATLLNNIIIILLQIIARWGCDDPGTLWWKRYRHSTINIILIIYNIVLLLPIRRYSQTARLISCRFSTFEHFDYLSEARYNMTLFENSSSTNMEHSSVCIIILHGCP